MRKCWFGAGAVGLGTLASCLMHVDVVIARADEILHRLNQTVGLAERFAMVWNRTRTLFADPYAKTEHRPHIPRTQPPRPMPPVPPQSAPPVEPTRPAKPQSNQPPTNKPPSSPPPEPPWPDPNSTRDGQCVHGICAKPSLTVTEVTTVYECVLKMLADAHKRHYVGSRQITWERAPRLKWSWSEMRAELPVVVPKEHYHPSLLGLVHCGTRGPE